MKMKVKVTQSYPTLFDPMDYTVHGLLQARILEWVAFPFFRGSFQSRDRTQVSCIVGRFFTSCTTWAEKAMAPHSSTLAWKTPRMEEPGRLQSMGSRSQTQLSNFTFSFPCCVLKSVFCFCVSIPALQIGSSVPFF